VQPARGDADLRTHPNSPPSANWVLALCSTMALSTSRRNRSATAPSRAMMLSVWCEP
jgi:hypothetical protein